MTDFETFLYEVESKWFGLRKRFIRIEAESGVMASYGPWRFRMQKVHDDVMGETFMLLMAAFAAKREDTP